MKYTEAIQRILDLLSVCVKVDGRDQDIIGREIEGYIKRLPHLDKTGVSPQLEESLANLVELYGKYLSTSPGERIIYGDQLEKEIEKVLQL